MLCFPRVQGLGGLILLRCVLGHGKAFPTVLSTCAPPKSPVILGECFWSFLLFFFCHAVDLKHLFAGNGWLDGGG